MCTCTSACPCTHPYAADPLRARFLHGSRRHHSGCDADRSIRPCPLSAATVSSTTITTTDSSSCSNAPIGAVRLGPHCSRPVLHVHGGRRPTCSRGNICHQDFNHALHHRLRCRFCSRVGRRWYGGRRCGRCQRWWGGGTAAIWGAALHDVSECGSRSHPTSATRVQLSLLCVGRAQPDPYAIEPIEAPHGKRGRRG